MKTERVAQMRRWVQEVGEAQSMVAAAMRRNGATTIAEFAEKHPKQFNSLYAAIETMQEELPEPEFPWPKIL